MNPAAPDYATAFAAKLVYVFRIPDEAHDGFLKIGEATVPRGLAPAALAPNCRELNRAAKERIDSYTKTAGVRYELLHAETMVPSTDAARRRPPSGDAAVHAFREIPPVAPAVECLCLVRAQCAIAVEVAPKGDLDAVRQAALQGEAHLELAQMRIVSVEGYVGGDLRVCERRHRRGRHGYSPRACRNARRDCNKTNTQPFHACGMKTGGRGTPCQRKCTSLAHSTISLLWKWLELYHILAAISIIGRTHTRAASRFCTMR